ncbi:G2/M phase-specific E3 ubiquitin-protein ligase [Drosophila mojavensis]|uniref:PHD-type domain-containing protein n=1 Tax=Drosophila mojavensis TaxID=7230 RepID=B4L4S3_DROMO|nr:G2/M phase-specific E3 ubiquitin-protein ligase [Drosophila mojavensis]EDW07551.1 uncharacterized protein Dmoj_GI14805 [Drosophila mojavensis]
MKKCILCRSASEDELHLGKLYVHGEIIVHQNCLYLSSNLVQRGNSRNGILNFTFKDILTESERTKYIYCCFCHSGGANIGCCNLGCRRSFHTCCGIENRVQNQFIGTFKSFCNMHVNTYSERPKTDEKCVICFEDLLKKRERFCRTQHIHGKCCKNGWYHKDCLQRYANSAGYFFKCPLCNDVNQFKMVTFWGISVPNRDASWEDNDAYADQMEIPLDCVAQNCVNAAGRKGSLQTLLYCLLCGSNPVHTLCTLMKTENYCCEACSVVLRKPDDTTSDSEDTDEDPLEQFVYRSNAVRPTNTASQTETQATQAQTQTQTQAQAKAKSDSSDSDSDSNSSSDFDYYLSKFPQNGNDKENVDRALTVPTTTATATASASPAQASPAPIAPASPVPASPAPASPAPPVSAPSLPSPPTQLQPIPIPAEPQPQAQPLNINMIPSIDEPSRMRNNRQAASSARRAQNTVTEPRRLRSRSNHTRGRRSPSTEPVDRRNNNRERRSIRNRRRSSSDTQNTNTVTSRGRQRVRTFGSQARSHGPSPFDVSCVANRTRARSRR